ncbi:5-methyltetrahydropteroyltriglutamate--homocysteine S-methyltransferase [Bacillus sp. MRMR6]|uniref:5-methyltetrahydropteroyltriglutamate-- homocysteine S-methyltransferase n=1 Tax=Bacillus sp. MRMR6 TaxID=1928617 RepID=UPI00095316F5|nr:5-methyltetrahydropteroyltriglutamate--homocysteine S-methyltransferase [Bacillus sp. MRMR6]OLS40452.1 5-methyltetrahydropteroyltriglutamate--homocysteine S-methyltransferase [Bacillus sp. MRMR6]
MNVTSTVIGYPYIGENREWKKCLEAYWKNSYSEEDFLVEMKKLRLANLKRQQSLGLEMVTVGDFTFYDRILDTAVMFGLIPKRYNWKSQEVDFSTYYAMARGSNNSVACEMTKWFNTNYHYIVPEYENQLLRLTQNTLLTWFLEAKEELGILARPTMIGPYTFLKLTKGYGRNNLPGFILKLIPLYIQVVKELVAAGAEWIQLEEPGLVLSISKEDVQLVQEIYRQLNQAVPEAKIMLQTYFEAVSGYEEIVQLPVQGIGLDFVYGAERNMASLRQFGFPEEKVLGIGLINGRDIWRANLEEKAQTVQAIIQLSKASDVWIQSSCSLQHVPITTRLEHKLDQTLKNALSFADEKIVEISQITSYLQKPNWEGKSSISESMQAIIELEQHQVRNNTAVGESLRKIDENDFKRNQAFETRQRIQQEALKLPILPTTTIGSLPQSEEVKRKRSAWRKKEITDKEYADFLEQESARWIRIQEEIGLDVLVHGEFERTDMVEYFGEKLDGFAFTERAWVVSYGSRCVKPPIIYGDVQWHTPMTVKETKAAQEKTAKFVKGMLTGPVTILNWSFVRDDLSREKVAYQIALALRKEIQCLEESGISIIQVDEPALREGLPLRKEDWPHYLDWAVKSFRLATSQVKDSTQIHTHMCYCEFNDFIEPIRALEADVISIETSRSHGELIESLKKHPYGNGIGLGVYDIHSPRIPSIDEMLTIMQESLQVLNVNQFWVNPDCGLKTRREFETVASLKNMVKSTKLLREQVGNVTFF